MKLSTRPRYALRLMLDVAREGGDETPVSLASVARHTGLSRPYLEQLALTLRNSGLLRGVCGKGGGYRLARDPEEITVREILEAAMGPVALVDCIIDPDTCIRAEFCECRPVYSLINGRINDVLDSFKLADLLDPKRVAVMSREMGAHQDERPGPGSDGPRSGVEGAQPKVSR